MMRKLVKQGAYTYAEAVEWRGGMARLLRKRRISRGLKMMTTENGVTYHDANCAARENLGECTCERAPEIEPEIYTKYCDIPQRNQQNETAAQIVGGFMMHFGQAPWEAERLLEWLERGGFEIVLKTPR